MAETIKGISIVIGAETTGLSKALAEVDKKSKSLQSELKQVEKLLKLDPTNTVLLAQKHKLLADAVANSKGKLDQLKKAQQQVNEQFKKGEISEGQYRAFQREVVKAEQDLKKLDSQGVKTNDTLSNDKAVSNLKNIRIAAGAAAVAVGAMIASMTGKVLEDADELQRLSDVTGITAERLQELRYAGNNLGVELDTITGAQAKLTKAMNSATDETKGTGLAFARLGVDVRDSNGNLRDAKDVMFEAFTALNGVGNETERDALAMQIFGKSAMEMNPLIKAGGEELKRLTDEARANGAVMSNEAVSGLDTFGDAMDNLKNSVLGRFGEVLGKIINQFLELSPATQNVILGITGLGIVSGGALATFALLAKSITIIKEAEIMATTASLAHTIAMKGATIATGALTAATWLLNVAIAVLTSPITLIVVAVAAVVAGLVLWYNKSEWLRTKLREIMTDIADYFKTRINEIISFINLLIKAINKIPGVKLGEIGKLTLSSGTSATGMAGFKQIQGFATGGVVTKPTLAMIGEREPEVITPVSKLKSSGTNIDYDRLGAAVARALAATNITAKIDTSTGQMVALERKLQPARKGELLRGSY